VQYYLQVGEREELISSPQQLRKIIEREFSKTVSDLYLFQDKGKVVGFERVLCKILGISTRVIGKSVSVLTKGEIATVSFLNEGHSEHVVINPDAKENVKELIEFTISNGEKDFRRNSECIEKSVAEKCLLFFYEHGEKPDWLKYKFNK
jgi:hypothetical protein